MKFSAIATLLACIPVQAASSLVLSPDGQTVYDSVNKINWLANANLPAINRFGIPLCTPGTAQTCINASGSMSYQAAAAWVAAMNAAGYLGHTNWQLPTTPLVDPTCGFVGPTNNSFGFSCTNSALGSLYYNALALKSPNTAVPIPNTPTGAFTNFQPYLYWSQTFASETGSGEATYSFASGFQGTNTLPNFLYVLPMIPGKISSPQTVYDSVNNVTWLANANIAASNTFGLPACVDQGNPKLCVNKDGAMNWDSASQFITNMNTAAYLGQTHWQLPTLDPTCTGYKCASPLSAIYANQLNLTPGTPVVPTPNTPVGPFNNIQPYLYWSCQGTAIAQPCSTALPAPGFEWSFSFGNGFEGTDLFENDLYVTAYFPGSPTTATGPEITEVANAEGESPILAPNTWVEVKGLNLAPAGDSRIWQGTDFIGNQMPTQLDKVSVTLNGKNAFVYYISPTQINILTPPDPLTSPVQVVVTNNGTSTGNFTVQAQPLAPSFFLLNGGPYITATHASGALIGPATLYPGVSTPAQPGETIVIYANGFGPTTAPVVSGSVTQSGTLSPLPVIKIGSATATVTFAGLVSPGEFQFNVVIPNTVPDGDQSITATYNGYATPAGALLTVLR